MEYTFLACKQNVGGGLNTMLSISDGLSPSIFCRNVEKTRLMREEMDVKVVSFPPGSAFPLYFCLFIAVILPICTLTWRVNKFYFRQEKV